MRLIYINGWNNLTLRVEITQTNREFPIQAIARLLDVLAENNVNNWNSTFKSYPMTSIASYFLLQQSG